MRISDWSSDVCSSDLLVHVGRAKSLAVAGEDHEPVRWHVAEGDGRRDRLVRIAIRQIARGAVGVEAQAGDDQHVAGQHAERLGDRALRLGEEAIESRVGIGHALAFAARRGAVLAIAIEIAAVRSEEHTSELQSLMRIPYAVFFLKKKK